MKILFKFSLLLCVIGIVSCGKKPNAMPDPVKELKTYSFADATKKYSIQYPSNWVLKEIPGQTVRAFSNPNVVERFVKFNDDGASGAEIEYSIQQLSDRTLEQVMDETKMFEATMYTAPVDVTVKGLTGKKITYTFDLSDGKFFGEKYFFLVDSTTVAIVDFAAFGSTFEAYKDMYSKVLSTIDFPEKVAKKVADTTKQTTEVELPSKNFRTFIGNGFSISYPDNFFNNRSRSGGAESSINFVNNRTGRVDCNIQVDVFDASKQNNLEKIVEDNKAKYRVSNASKTSIGGNTAYSMNYSFQKDVGSRVYFTVKNNKLYRITINWFRPDEANYLPLFMKSIDSFKFS